MKLPRLWLCRLIKDRLKKERMAADRWWERWTNRWRKYKAQYWFLVSSEVRQDACSCLYMLRSAPDFFCPSLILADNASPSLCVCALLTLCMFSLRLKKIRDQNQTLYIHMFRAEILYTLMDFPQNRPLTALSPPSQESDEVPLLW